MNLEPYPQDSAYTVVTLETAEECMDFGLSSSPIKNRLLGWIGLRSHVTLPHRELVKNTQLLQKALHINELGVTKHQVGMAYQILSYRPTTDHAPIDSSEVLAA